MFTGSVKQFIFFVSSNFSFACAFLLMGLKFKDPSVLGGDKSAERSSLRKHYSLASIATVSV